jgi:predicted lipoprotein with Yx(FWY)xxD motif
MRKSGWTAATGIGSLVLLLAACGGSSPSTSAAGSGSSAGQPSSGSSGPVAPASSVSPVATATKSAKGSSSSSSSAPSPKPHHTAGPQPSSADDQSIPAVGTTVMIVQHSNLGYVLAKAGGQVVYTYSKDKKGGPATCTGSCASTWPPATGTPQAGPADHFPGTFTVVKGAGGVQQIAYNGMPLYTFAGAKPYATTGNGVDGVWHVVKLSASDITTG